MRTSVRVDGHIFPVEMPECICIFSKRPNRNFLVNKYFILLEMNNYCILSVYNYIYKGATVVQYSICVLGFCCFICNFVHAFPYVFAFTCKNIINFPELIVYSV